jgi:GntR family transcriptional repressor for pyruvate dehydrogenase complex
MSASQEAPAYRAVATRKLHEAVVEQIQEQIITGQLHPGDRLPPEPELCEQFGVSRTVVREAFQVLQERGLLEVRQGQGTFVTEPTAETVSSALRLLAQVGGASTMEVAEVRDLLESEVAVLAAERAKPQNHRRLEECLHRMEEDLDNPRRFVEADVAFHRELVRATGNMVLELIVAPLYELMRDARGSIVDVPGGPERALARHRAIYRAVRDGDREQARAAMRGHIDQVREDIRRLHLDERLPE